MVQRKAQAGKQVAISSMTGFARNEGQDGACIWVWEARSVNSKGLDIRCRLPPGFEGLDPQLRERVQKLFKRGSVSAALTVTWTKDTAQVSLNRSVLETVLAAIPEIQARLPSARPPSIDGLLAVRGVIEATDETLMGDARDALLVTLIMGLDETLKRLLAMRREEGERLRVILEQHLENIADLCRAAETLANSQPAAIRDRLQTQIKTLLESSPSLPEERLAQEAVLLATKMDPREELDRLKAHHSATIALLKRGDAIGRKLDFLCQEFNREANTLCSKSGDIELTRIGIDLKVAIDQLREQVQNIE